MEWPGGVRQAKEPLKDGDLRWVGDWVEGVGKEGMGCVQGGVAFGAGL